MGLGRYCPPQPKSSPYITPEGYDHLKHELELIWKRRADVTQALSAAAAEGDRSENAEYIYRKKELRELDRRIRYLQKRMPDLKVVRDPPTDSSRIFFGAWVRLEDEAGIEKVFRIVGPDELDPGNGWISLDSPMARALLKKTIDDEISVTTPEKEAIWYVLEVSYQPL